MPQIKLPSLAIPDSQKSAFSEADVHSTLFEPDMQALGFPPRTSSQADGEYFVEQRSLAVRRLQSRRATGRYDGLYLAGNAPVVLCEIKRFDALDSLQAATMAVRQLQSYALSDDFASPPPFLLLYCGKPDRTRFFRLKTVGEGTLLDETAYEEVGDLWTWQQITEYHLRGAFAEEVVSADRLREILTFHLDQIENDLRAPVAQAIQIVKSGSPPALVGAFGQWLLDRPEAIRRIRMLFERKVAEVGRDNEQRVAGEIVTQAALNYLNKVFFLNLCEDRNLAGFYRIMREFLPRSRSETSPTTATVFLALLRRRIRDEARDWNQTDEHAYRALREQLAPSIRQHVIEQNSWPELIRVAFDLASEHFPLVYREDAFDYFLPSKTVLAELIYDLSTKSFRGLTSQNVGDIYESLLSSRRQQQSKLGAFYTPDGDVHYMVSKLNLTAHSTVLDPCMGSGHFLDGIYEELARLYGEQGVESAQAYRQIVENQIYGGDIDSFALSLAAIRLFLLSDEAVEARPHLYVHDMLLYSPARAQEALFTDAESVIASDPDLDELGEIDRIEFDAVVGNPPYGARKPEYKKKVYGRLYGQREAELNAGSVGTGDGDSYSMFFANGIERLREGGRLCLITNDSFRTLTTHTALRRRILDTCKIVEILLTDTKHFEGVSFQFAGMAITTLERCGDPAARAANEMRLVDYIREPKDYWTPPAEKVTVLRQEEYEALPETPFFVGVPAEVFIAAKGSLRLRDVARGRQGLATADDKRFLASVSDDRVVASGLATGISPDERTTGIEPGRPHWIPFAKGDGFGEYWRDVSTVIDWSRESVAELERRAAYKPGTPRKAYIRNREYYFRAGLTYSVVSSGRVSVRLMPAGGVFGHKGSAIFVEDESQDELFVLGYLNSALATFFMKKLVNSTATADVGYVEKLPYRKPGSDVEASVVERVTEIVDRLKVDAEADIQALRDEIDELIFDLFEIRASRDVVRRFYKSVGLVEQPGEDQAATE